MTHKAQREREGKEEPEREEGVARRMASDAAATRVQHSCPGSRAVNFALSLSLSILRMCYIYKTSRVWERIV